MRSLGVTPSPSRLPQGGETEGAVSGDDYFWIRVRKLFQLGKIPAEYRASEYVAEQLVERLAHYVLSAPTKGFSMPQLAPLLEQLAPRHQVFFFKRLKEARPNSLKDFAPLYDKFMAELRSFLST